jgi:hypothetical protein
MKKTSICVLSRGDVAVMSVLLLKYFGDDVLHGDYPMDLCSPVFTDT